MAGILCALVLFSVTGTLAQSGDAPSSRYNIPGQARTRDCVPMKGPKVPLRFADGSPTGWFVHGDDPSKLSPRHKPCLPGATEMDLHEALTNASGMRLYFHAGGGGSLYREPVENGQYGHIAEEDLASFPRTEGSINGKAAPLGSVQYLITPTRIPRGMYYKPNVSNGRSGSAYYTYGNPGYDKTGGRGDWTYINWSWVQNGAHTYPASRCPGGGMVRALGKRGDLFQSCRVKPIIGYSFGVDNQVNGRVTVFYGRMHAGPSDKGSEVFGWMPHSYQKNGDIIVPCVRRSQIAETAPESRRTSTNRMERMAWNLAYPATPDPKGREVILEKYSATRDRETRMELITELSRMDDAGTISALLKLIEAEPQPLLREQIIAVTGLLASAGDNIDAITETFSRNFQRTRDEREKLRTLDVISNFPAAPPVKFLTDAWRRGGSDSVRSGIVDALLKLAPSGLLDAGLLRDAKQFRVVNRIQVKSVGPAEEP